MEMRSAAEAYRISLAYLFDPLLAVHTSLIEPLPHQITAVYETMLTKQPLRYLLADDPGAGKTIMTGLLIKELLIRGVLRMMGGDAGKIMEEVVKHLTTPYEADVQVTLEIEARVPESTRRTVEENCRTLKFEGFGFEEE